MAGFTELIKKYDKIRFYLRDFLIYGFKSRNSYDTRSRRSYDNERRRIENYLSHDIKQKSTLAGKQFYIAYDALHQNYNPLFITWRTKSFTRYDVLLHYLIPDILQTKSELTISAITDMLATEYLIDELPDMMTVRNKLNEYEKLGILTKKKNAKTMIYSLSTDVISPLLHENVDQLTDAFKYFENVLPAGVIGNFLAEKNMPYNSVNNVFAFKHHYISNTLDSEILATLFTAIENTQAVEIICISKKPSIHVTFNIYPLEILNNVETGRQYLGGYHTKQAYYTTLRIDKIAGVKPLKQTFSYDDYIMPFDKKLSSAFGIHIPIKPQFEYLRMTLHINENTEQYLIDRIIREGRYGELHCTGEHQYVYEIEVLDVNEMVPWLRTFIGRILSIETNNERVNRVFKKDIETMYKLYTDD